jgi:hypothetical protein
VQAKIEIYVFISYFQFTIVHFSIFVNSMVEMYLVARKYPILEEKVQHSMQAICFNTRY